MVALGQRQSPRRLGRCTLIGRLAVAKVQQGQRFASILLADALLRAFESAGAVGSSMVIVDALDEAAAGFYARRTAWCGCRNRCVSSCRCVRPVREPNDNAFAVTAEAGEAPGEANPRRCRGLGKRAYPERQPTVPASRGFAANCRLQHMRALPMPKVAPGPLRPAYCCFPMLPGFADSGGEAKTVPGAVLSCGFS